MYHLAFEVTDFVYGEITDFVYSDTVCPIAPSARWGLSPAFSGGEGGTGRLCPRSPLWGERYRGSAPFPSGRAVRRVCDPVCPV